MLLRESMGLASDGAHKAFPSKDVDAFLDGPRATIHVDIMGRNSRYNTNHFVLAVDPSGGGASQFSICTMAQMPTGRVVVRRPLSPPTPPPCYAARGQLPTRSSGQSSAMTRAPATKASGAWHEWRRKRGSSSGSTRSCRSRASGSS